MTLIYLAFFGLQSWCFLLIRLLHKLILEQRLRVKYDIFSMTYLKETQLLLLLLPLLLSMHLATIITQHFALHGSVSACKCFKNIICDEWNFNFISYYTTFSCTPALLISSSSVIYLEIQILFSLNSCEILDVNRPCAFSHLTNITTSLWLLIFWFVNIFMDAKWC